MASVGIKQFTLGVSFRMAMYKCEACGKESSSSGMCCGQQMKMMS